MAEASETERAARCFVCGPDNPIGLKIPFRLDEHGVCRAEFQPGPDHAGYDQVTHGGILYSLLDDVMANGLWLRGDRAFTARCEVRYRQPLPVGVRIRLEGHIGPRKSRLVQTTGLIVRVDDDTVVAEAAAAFMIG